MENSALRIVVSKEEDMFVAQCLEHDISVQAPDIGRLQQRLIDAIWLESEEGSIADLPAAPAEFFRRWDEGVGLDLHVDSAQTRLAA